MIMREQEFTNQAEEVLAAMEKMAAADNRPSVGTEYLLLALASVGTGVARQILAAHKVAPQKVRNLIEELASAGELGKHSGHKGRGGLRPYSPRLTVFRQVPAPERREYESHRRKRPASSSEDHSR